MVKVVVINGMPRCGKTTFEQMCCDLCNYDISVPGFREGALLHVDICSTIDFVKMVAKDHFCWNGEKTPKARKFLSDLKDLLTEWDDIPFKKIETRVATRAHSVNDWIIFIDCREPAEIQKLKERLNAITVLMRRPAVEKDETSNHADAGVFEYKYDLEIWNDSDVETLGAIAKNFIEYMKKEEVPYYIDK